MRVIAAILIASFAYAATPNYAAAGNCDYSWNTAKDGSNCGDRAASQRYGGN